MVGTKTAPDRSKIALNQPELIKYWTRHLGVSESRLRQAIDKVGDSAAAVRKELGITAVGITSPKS